MKKMVTRLMMVLLLLNYSCSKKAFKCPYDPCAIVAPQSEITQLEAYLAGNNITAVKHCSGMYYQVLNPGEGAAPTGCSAVLVTYKGSLTNGTIFDQSVNPTPFSLIDLIKGWQNGIPLIQKGGKIRLYVPPTLGYGATANRDIPANSILIFDVDLLDVR
jgi:FKBP-type peptidyl-prolyl cis-trans isomerase FkpA